MTPRNLEWMLRLHGPALATWPEQERLAALALLRRSALARTALADALAREDALSLESLSADGDAAALARMRSGLDGAIASRAAPARLAAGARTTVRWGTLAACAVLGVWLGAGQAAADPQGGEQRDPLQAMASLSPASVLGALQP